MPQELGVKRRIKAGLNFRGRASGVAEKSFKLSVGLAPKSLCNVVHHRNSSACQLISQTPISTEPLTCTELIHETCQNSRLFPAVKILESLNLHYVSACPVGPLIRLGPLSPLGLVCALLPVSRFCRLGLFTRQLDRTDSPDSTDITDSADLTDSTGLTDSTDLTDSTRTQRTQQT